jgi:hypothetical protein
MVDPTPTPPRIDPAYGAVPDASGAELLPWSWAVERLVESRNYWLSATRPDGRPHATPVWGVWLDGAVWFCIGRSSVKARNITWNPTVVVHLESGDQVVILEGRVVEQHEGHEPFLDAYEAKYALRPDLVALAASVYALSPQSALTWDERDYPRTAVRWVFASGGDEGES